MATKIKAICKRTPESECLTPWDGIEEWEWFYMPTVDPSAGTYLGVKIHGKRYYPHLRIYCSGDENTFKVRRVKNIVIKEPCSGAV